MWCEVDPQALSENARQLKAHLAPGTALGVVVKSNAYGHGLTIAAQAFLRGGADWLVVNAIEEALALRQAGLTAPIYVCGNVPLFQLESVVSARARIVVYDAETVKALSALAAARQSEIGVHLKLETGTHRQGLQLDDALALGRLVSSLPSLKLEGLTTHYADIEDSTNHRFADGQLDALQRGMTAFAEAGMPIPVPHSANSAATLLYPKTHGKLVRVGIAAYGLWPSKETMASSLQKKLDGAAEHSVTLTPALSWRARVVQVKDVPSGAYIGYGRTYRTTHAARIAVLPLGYYEGYDRRLSNVAHVLIAGQRAPVRGRICMNMCMIDVTHIPEARTGAVATLLGGDGDEVISAEQLAGWMQTIHYEAVSRIHPAIARIVAPR